MLNRINAPSAILPVRLVLNLFSNVAFELVFTRFDNPGAGRLVWHGSVVGQPGSQVTLAVSGKAVAGSLLVPGRGMFQLQHAGDGWQRITEVDGEQLPRCGAERESSSTLVPQIFAEPAVQAASAPGNSTNAVIDLLVVYTAAARAGAGGPGGISALIDAAVAEANLAFDNSQVSAQLRLVHRAEVDYVETGNINEDLDRLEDDGQSSPLYGVRLLRGQYRADLVCLITEQTGGPFGLANQMHAVDVEFGEKAFSIVKREYAVSYQALAHEIGHNMGCQHDRSVSPTGGAFEYSHAHRFEVDGTLYHTVMAYQPGLPIPCFSNPDVTFMGVPTGVSEASTNSANNAKTLSLTAPTVARFDSVMPDGVPPQISLVTPTNGAVFIVPAVVELSVEASDSDGQIIEVEFYVNGTVVGRRFNPPYTMLWTNSLPGTHTFAVEVIDDDDWEVFSRKARVKFVYPPPTIDAAASFSDLDGAFNLRVVGTDGQAFAIQGSSNLVNWLQLTTDSFSGSWYDFMDSQTTNLPVRFYRVLPVE